MSGRPRDPFDDPVWNRPPTYPRIVIAARLVAVMDFQRADRGLVLIRQRTRCIRRFDVHELILTDEAEAEPGGTAGRVAYLGFVEFSRGGVLAQGDLVCRDDLALGEVVGFDETHMPNHLNIVIRAAQLRNGVDLGLSLWDRLTFTGPGRD